MNKPDREQMLADFIKTIKQNLPPGHGIFLPIDPNNEILNARQAALALIAEDKNSRQNLSTDVRFIGWYISLTNTKLDRHQLIATIAALLTQDPPSNS